MSARWTVERLLRDDDDASGQTVRGWEIRREANFIDLRDNNEEERHRILIRVEDVPLLIADLQAMAAREEDGAKNPASASAQ